MDRNRALAWMLGGLGAGLAANAALGPLLLGVIDYHFSDTLINQAIGLDAVSLVVVAPLAVVAAGLAWRGHPAGAVLALGPALFAVYMLIQYVVGPDYLRYPGNNERFFALHAGLFTLAAAAGLTAWAAIAPGSLPALEGRARRIAGSVCIALGLFVVFGMYLANGFIGAMSDFPAYAHEAGRGEYLENPGMLWIVAFLDLAVVVPLAIATGVALLRRAAWGQKAGYAVAGWFALVGPSVAAMSITMAARDDPNGSWGRAVAFTVLAAVGLLAAVRVYWPLFRSPALRTRRAHRPAAGRRVAA